MNEFGTIILNTLKAIVKTSLFVWYLSQIHYTERIENI